METLPIPPEARKPGAKQIISVWAYDEVTDNAIEFRHWSDPGEWGILLAHLAQDLANDIAGHRGLNAGNVLYQIRQGFEKEIGRS